MRVLIAALLAMSGSAHAVGCLSPEESQLVTLVNAYRVSNGLSALPASRWLSTTGQWHVWDRINNPNAVGGACNAHSWSNNPPIGVTWQGMCYTADHAQAVQMWGKPGQISGGQWVGHGFENSADSWQQQTAQSALIQWQNSPAHNAVILQQGSWGSITFLGLGVGIAGNFAVLWFGDGPDPSGVMAPCAVDAVFANGLED